MPNIVPIAIVPASTALVAVLTQDEGLVKSIHNCVADDWTFVVHQSAFTESQRSRLSLQRPDVVVIDARGADDVSVQMRRVRLRWPTIEIFVITNHSEVDIGQLLDLGADDAVGVNSPLLASRLHAQVRRARTVNASARIAVGDIVFDREARRVWCAVHEISLTPRECALLDCLFWHAPAPVSLAAATEWVWGSAGAGRAVVDVYVGYLRKRLVGSKRVRIRTIRHVGFCFAPLEAFPVEVPIAHPGEPLGRSGAF